MAASNGRVWVREREKGNECGLRRGCIMGGSGGKNNGTGWERLWGGSGEGVGMGREEVEKGICE